jgi:periplasmic protein TonB
MSDPLVATSPLRGPKDYELSDDLAQLCLPSEFKDSYRSLAWVDSVCLLFLMVGLIGLRPPKIVERPLNAPQEIVPVILTPPEEQPKPQPQIKPPDEPQETPDVPAEAPQIPTVVAANTPNVAFAVPVEGPVALAPMAHAAPPPPLVSAPPKIAKFDPNATTGGGSYPPPEYPYEALRSRYQGTVIIELTVDPSGVVTSAKLQTSSGFGLLDEAALKVVKKRWRFPPGAPRYYYWPCTFKIQ